MFIPSLIFSKVSRVLRAFCRYFSCRFFQSLNNSSRVMLGVVDIVESIFALRPNVSSKGVLSCCFVN